MRDLINAAEHSILRHRLIHDGQRVLVAVSGGLDSTVLLDVLVRLSSSHKWSLVVAHFNHLLRRREADADERFVERLSHRLRIPFRSGRGDVRRLAQKTGLSFEMAGRQLRHEFLAKTSREIGIPVVATAHHADDQVELLLLRLLRGGGAGLSGMPWSNPSPADDSVRIVRPFLDQPKDILTHYAKTHELEFREDASNQSTDILRNRIRHELVPLMRTYELAFSTNALRTMEIIGTNEDFIKGKAVEWRKRRRKPSFLNLNPAVQRQIVRLQLLEMGIIPGFEIVEALRQWPDRAVTVRPRRSIACNRDGIVADSLTGSINFNPRQLGLKMSKPRGRAEFNGLTFNWQIHIGGSVRPRCQRGMSMCEWFDAGRVGDRVILRHWQPGDRFQPIGMCKAVKLQDLFTNQKVPRKKRVTLVVATTWSGAIFWVEGLRIGEEFKLRTDTTRTLRWRWSPRKGD